MRYSSFSQPPVSHSKSLTVSVFSNIMLFGSLLVLAAAAVSASPVERQVKTAVIPLKHYSNLTSIKNIVDKGQLRINKINGVNSKRADSGDVTNEDVSYYAPVVIGGATWQLIVDTGCMLLLETE